MEGERIKIKIKIIIIISGRELVAP